MKQKLMLLDSRTGSFHALRLHARHGTLSGCHQDRDNVRRMRAIFSSQEHSANGNCRLRRRCEPVKNDAGIQGYR